MSHYRIGVVVGSLRRDSLNRQLASAIQALVPKGWECDPIRIDDLPPYNQDAEAKPPAPVKRLKAQIAAVQAVLFVTPEYNRSIPGALKNAIDHASRPYGQSAWTGKPAGVVGLSMGAPGSSMAQQHLRNILAYLDMPTLGQPEVFIHAKPGFFDDTGRIADDESRAFVQTWVDTFVAWVKAHATASAETEPAAAPGPVMTSRKERARATVAALKIKPYGASIDARAIVRATTGKRWAARKPR